MENDSESADSANADSLGKAALSVLVGGLVLWALGMVTGYADLAIVICLLAIVSAFVLGIISRQSRPGRLTLYASGALLLYGAASYVMFQKMSADSLEQNQQAFEAAQEQAQQGDSPNQAQK